MPKAASSSRSTADGANSVGIAAAGGADGADELLMRADIAMYAAKQQGPGRHEISKGALLEAALHNNPA